MAATAQEKAYNLKDGYVADLVDKSKKNTPVLPETNHGEVAIDPITIGIGAAVATSAAGLWHLPEMHEAATGLTGAIFNTEMRETRGQKARRENDKQNRGPSLLKMIGIGNYDRFNYDKRHFDRTGKIKKKY